RVGAADRPAARLRHRLGVRRDERRDRLARRRALPRVAQAAAAPAGARRLSGADEPGAGARLLSTPPRPGARRLRAPPADRGRARAAGRRGPGRCPRQDVRGAVLAMELETKTRLKPTLSVVIPALDEEANIVDAVKETLDALGDRFSDYEILLFDDGSRDRTG